MVLKRVENAKIAQDCRGTAFSTLFHVKARYTRHLCLPMLLTRIYATIYLASSSTPDVASP
jgi:hypothetical protein